MQATTTDFSLLCDSLKSAQKLIMDTRTHSMADTEKLLKACALIKTVRHRIFLEKLQGESTEDYFKRVEKMLPSSQLNLDDVDK